MREPLYKVGDRVRVNGWVGSATGTVEDSAWIYHPRMYQYTWGYLVKYDPGETPGLAFNYVPEGYVQPLSLEGHA